MSTEEHTPEDTLEILLDENSTLEGALEDEIQKGVRLEKQLDELRAAIWEIRNLLPFARGKVSDQTYTRLCTAVEAVQALKSPKVDPSRIVWLGLHRVDLPYMPLTTHRPMGTFEVIYAPLVGWILSSPVPLEGSGEYRGQHLLTLDLDLSREDVLRIAEGYIRKVEAELPTGDAC